MKLNSLREVIAYGAGFPWTICSKSVGCLGDKLMELPPTFDYLLMFPHQSMAYQWLLGKHVKTLPKESRELKLAGILEVLKGERSGPV